MTYEIKKQQTIDQQILESDIKDPTKFSLNQEYNFAKNDLSNKTDEHESDNRLQNSSDHDSDDSSTDGNQTPYTESSDWDSNSSCSSDYSCFLEESSFSMLQEIPLTENEECLIGEFCKEIKGKIEENEREYKTKISKQEGIENWTEGALERIKSVVDKYLGKGIKLNSRCNSSEETVVNLIFNEIVGVLESTTNTTSGGRSSRFDPIDLLDYSQDEDEATKDENISIIQSIVRDLLLKGGRVKRHLFHHDRIGHATTAFVDNSSLQFDEHLFAECKEIENDLKNVAYESIVNKNEQAQKDKLELKVEIDNECFCIKYPQDSTVEVAKILSNEKNKGLNLRVGILQIGKSIVRVESYNGKRNYLDVLKQGVTLSFDSEAGKISIHLNPKENSNKIEVEIDKESEARLNKLEDKGKSLGEGCLLGRKSVWKAIRDGNFERNSIPKESTNVIEQPNAATNTPRSNLENISLSGHNDRTKHIDSRHG
ncbi:hypothetical protein [Wolbachia endosymbiont of Psylliodes chrysocephala]|uniref:hypothetical protein n=1 Tax=Wolbachia endosymbiont of Psylliodes chrysocephala TaxID=2883236 RepID=UPI0020A207E2|nr:hypothetical protein [Wolbachia endosymbiont of Psylliodes chrysocephala]